LRLVYYLTWSLHHPQLFGFLDPFRVPLSLTVYRKTLDFWYYPYYNLTVSGKIGRPRTGRTPNFSIRINPDALQQARHAAVNQEKTLGQWLGEAIKEKIQREQKSQL